MLSLLFHWLFCFVLASQERTFALELHDPDSRQAFFIGDDFHYLNVPRVGTRIVHNIFDCTFKCLNNPSCLSLNLAASKKVDGKLWCELLSSVKYSNPEEFKGNDTSHHYSIKTPCRPSPCQNGGTCVPSNKYDTFKCTCTEGFIGEYCERAAEKSCKDVYDKYKLNISQVATLILDSKPTSVLCHMGDFGCGEGGWTPVMKIDGSKETFHFSSSLWSNNETYNLAGGETGFDSQETKMPSYWDTPFSKICLGMKIGQQVNFITINKQASSLYTLIADGQYRATSLGRNAWKYLVGSKASLQHNCNKEGFNAVSSSKAWAKVRIGILGNNEAQCNSCDSRIGFGAGGKHDDSNTCGNEATRAGDNGDKHIKAMGFILVQ